MKFIKPMIFIIAFILVTGLIMVLNSFYANIFQFNFTPVSAKMSGVDSTKSIKKQKDSMFTTTTTVQTQDSSVSDSSVISKDSLTPKTDMISTLPQTTSTNRDTNFIPANKNDSISVTTVFDSTYYKWINATARVYESMDSKKAARIIQNYSEKVAHDIIYKMKKKKAAEILAELNPLIAMKITTFGG